MLLVASPADILSILILKIRQSCALQETGALLILRQDWGGVMGVSLDKSSQGNSIAPVSD